MWRHIGNVVSGFSIAAGVLLVAPDDTPLWKIVVVLLIICFGTTLGDAISDESKEQSP